MKHGSHFRSRCANCGTIVAQCRCPGPKEERSVLGCPNCAPSGPTPGTVRPEERDRMRQRPSVDRKPEDMVLVDSSGRVVRDRIDAVGNDLTATLRWCETHNEPVWTFRDGSYTCPHTTSVGFDTEDHVLVDAPWERR